MALSDGLYDLLLIERLARSLAALDPGSAEVLSLKGGAPELLVDVITRQLGAILEANCWRWTLACSAMGGLACSSVELAARQNSFSQLSWSFTSLPSVMQVNTRRLFLLSAVQPSRLSCIDAPCLTK